MLKERIRNGTSEAQCALEVVARHMGDFSHVVRQSEWGTNVNFVFCREVSVYSLCLCFLLD